MWCKSFSLIKFKTQRAAAGHASYFLDIYLPAISDELCTKSLLWTSCRQCAQHIWQNNYSNHTVDFFHCTSSITAGSICERASQDKRGDVLVMTNKFIVCCICLKHLYHNGLLQIHVLLHTLWIVTGEIAFCAFTQQWECRMLNDFSKMYWKINWLVAVNKLVTKLKFAKL